MLETERAAYVPSGNDVHGSLLGGECNQPPLSHQVPTPLLIFTSNFFLLMAYIVYYVIFLLLYNQLTLTGAGWNGTGFAPGSEAEVAKLPGRLVRYLGFMKGRAQQYQQRQTAAAAASPPSPSNATITTSPPAAIAPASATALPPPGNAAVEQPRKPATPTRVKSKAAAVRSSPSQPKAQATSKPCLHSPAPPSPMDPARAALVAKRDLLKRRLAQYTAMKSKAELMLQSFVLFSSMPKVQARQYLEKHGWNYVAATKTFAAESAADNAKSSGNTATAAAALPPPPPSSSSTTTPPHTPLYCRCCRCSSWCCGCVALWNAQGSRDKRNLRHLQRCNRS